MVCDCSRFSLRMGGWAICLLSFLCGGCLVKDDGCDSGASTVLLPLQSHLLFFRITRFFPISSSNQPPVSSHCPSGASAGGQVVLLVNNLEEGVTTVEDLFQLFGNYGDVIRVKILFHKRNTAFVEMKDGSQVWSRKGGGASPGVARRGLRLNV